MVKFSYPKTFTFEKIFLRFIWEIFWLLLFRTTPRWCLNNWRIFLLRLFGSKIGHGNKISPTCKIWAPWNLEIGNKSAVGSYVDLYCMDKIIIGNNVTISQYSFLCTGSHDIRFKSLPLKVDKIHIKDFAWVCAGSFIAAGCIIGEGAITSARSVCFKSVLDLNIVSGNPAKLISKRKIIE